MAHLPAGTIIAGYRIEEFAGEGGMGVVYRATQLGLDRHVALKLIGADYGDDDEFRERFKRESKTAASIEHPHVLPVHEAGEADGRLFISMRYVEGTDLRALILAEGRLEPVRAARILAQVAAALDAAHAHGLVHRDIKPGNVLISSGDDGDHAFLTDFGLTKQSGAQSGLTRTGTWVGTLDYVAPEQIMGGHVDARSDVYALGCVLFHALSGHVPYQRDSDVAKLWSHMNDPPPRLSEEAPAVGKDLDLVLGRAMAKDPDARYPSATDFARAVEAAMVGTQVEQPERSVARGAAAPAQPGPAPTRSAAGLVGSARAARGAFLAGVVAATVVGALALLVTGTLSGDDEGSGESSPAANHVTITPITVVNPSGLAVGDGKAWVSSYKQDKVTAIDERTARLRTQVETGDGPTGLAIGDGSLWVSQTDAGSIGRVDLEQRRLVGAPTPLSSGEGDVIDVGEGAVWAANPFEERPEVGRIDPRSGRVTKRIRVPGGLNGDLAVGEGGVWAVNKQRPTVTYVDAGAAKVVGEPIPVGKPIDEFGGEVAVGAGSVWATSPEDDTVSRIDPRSRKVVETIKVPTGVGGDVAVGRRFVWVVNDDNSLVRIDPGSNSVNGLPLPGSPVGIQDLEVGSDALWVTGSADTDTVLRIRPAGGS